MTEPNPDTPTDEDVIPDEKTDDGAPALRLDARRALVALVKGPFVMRERTPNVWTALIDAEPAIRRSLADLFLDLVIDPDLGLAFARNQRDIDDAPKTIRSAPLTLLDTALVLFLRERLLRTDGRTFVGRDEIDDQISVYGQAAGVDAVLLTKRINASVTKMKDNGVLQATDEDGRFEVSPVLRMVFDADEVRAVAAEMRGLIDAGGRIAETDDSDTEGDDQ